MGPVVPHGKGCHKQQILVNFGTQLYMQPGIVIVKRLTKIHRISKSF